MESKKDLCTACWMERHEGCNDEVIQSDHCAYYQCPNAQKRELELINVKHATRVPILYWRKCRGEATSSKGTKYRVVSIAIAGHDGVILVLNSGRFASRKATSFKIDVESYHDERELTAVKSSASLSSNA